MDILKSVKKEIDKISKNNEVILFGSRARNDFKNDSDWDFLILLKEEITKAEKNHIRDKLYEIELQAEEVISSLIHSEEEWERRSITPIYKIIDEEGIKA